MKDVLDSREFYELCQKYRHSLMGADEFQRLKEWIRMHASVVEWLEAAEYEEDRGLVK